MVLMKFKGFMKKNFLFLVCSLFISISSVNALDSAKLGSYCNSPNNNNNSVATSNEIHDKEYIQNILQEKIKAYDTKLVDLQNKNIALQREISSLSSKLNSLTKDHKNYMNQENIKILELNDKIKTIIDKLETENLNHKNTMTKIEDRLNSQSIVTDNIINENINNKKFVDENFSKFNSNIKNISSNITNLKSSTEYIQSSVSSVDHKTDDAIENIKNNSYIGVLLVISLILIIVIIFILLNKKILKGQSSINDLQLQSEKINIEIVDKLSKDAETFTEILNTINSKQNLSIKDEDHSLVLSLSDRIGFMQTTLYRMDPKVRGHKQLSKTINQMKESLLAKGYEIVDMLGKPYNDGMKVIASFTEDETLPEGTQIISGITKPQVNFNGVMIQSAQIQVNQNK